MRGRQQRQCDRHKSNSERFIASWSDANSKTGDGGKAVRCGKAVPHRLFVVGMPTVAAVLIVMASPFFLQTKIPLVDLPGYARQRILFPVAGIRSDPEG